VTIDFAQHLIDAETATRPEVEAAMLLHVKRAVPFLGALCDVRSDFRETVELELKRMCGPSVSATTPDPALTALLPTGMCARLLAYPMSLNVSTGVVDILAADPTEAWLSHEFSYHLGRSVRLLRGEVGQVMENLREFENPNGPITARQDVAHMNEAPPPESRLGMDSLPPIPLVRRPPVLASMLPTTTRGVAPQHTDTSGSFQAPRVVVGKATAEPRRSPSPVANTADLVHPGALSMSLSGPSSDELEQALGELAVADDPEQVVEALALGMGLVSEETIVFAVRGNSLRSRVRLNYAGQTERFSDLEVRADSNCAVIKALDKGQVLSAPTPDDLLLFVGQPAEVCATRVQVQGRVALAFAAAGFRDSFEVSRRADRLARAASDALSRILLARKK
jgi:hypothetical protein